MYASVERQARDGRHGHSGDGRPWGPAASAAIGGHVLLRPREVEVLQLAVAGLTTPAIAKELVLSPRTVQTHIAHLLQKTGSENRVQLATWAVCSGAVACPRCATPPAL